MQRVSDAWKAAGYAFIGLSAIFVLWFTTTFCFSTKLWLLAPDPTYAYLLNGLNVATLHGVGHTDHPGTVLQILCGVLLRIFYFFAPDFNSNDFISSVLTHPEWYLKNIFTSFFVLQSLILTVVAASAWRSFHNVALLIVILTGLFSTPRLIAIQAPFLRPEILIPSLLLLLMLATLMRWRENTLNPSTPSRRLAWSVGVLTGLAFFTKVTCFPVFCASFFFWKDWKSRCRYLAGFVIIVLICLPFIWLRLGSAISWFIGLALHDGHYGSGSATILSPARFYTNMITIVFSNYNIVVLLVLTLVGLFILRKERHSLGWKISALYMLSIIIIMTLTAKHYNAHYLIAIYMPAFFVPCAYIAMSKEKWKLVALCTICSCIFFMSCNILYGRIAISSNSAAFSGKFAYYDFDNFKEKIIVESYHSYTISYGMSFGNDFTRNRYGERLRTIYNNVFTYNIGKNQFSHFGKPISFEDMALQGDIVIRGNRIKTNGVVNNLILGAEIASFPEGDALYTLTGVKQK
jgi:hypothetical protein